MSKYLGRKQFPTFFIFFGSTRIVNISNTDVFTFYILSIGLFIFHTDLSNMKVSFD